MFHRLAQLPRDTIIVSGAAKGADTHAEWAAEELQMDCVIFPADWDRFGRAAGPIRNRQMLDQKPDLVIAFHSDLSKSKGTADTVREAKRRGIKVEVIA